MNWEATWEKVKSRTFALTNLEGRIVGTGFFVTKYGHFLTCAHVVEEAGRWENLRFRDKREQKVEKVYLGNPDEDDIAVLKIENYQDDGVPISLDTTLNNTYYTFGYHRYDFPEGATIHGKITDTRPNSHFGNLPMIQLTAPIDAQKIEGGCSGAPVFDLNTQGVVGIVAAYDHEQGGLAIPLETVCQKWRLLGNYLDPNRQKKEELAAELHRVILAEYLVSPYNEKLPLKKHTYEEYFRLFYMVAGGREEILNKCFLEDINTFISQHKGVISLWIKGELGTGKSSFLSVAYWYFYDLYYHHQNILLPVFINLHRYSKFIKSDDSQNLSQEAQIENEWLYKKIDDHLNSLNQLIELCPNQEFLMIIDGYDSSSRLEDNIFKYLRRKYRNINNTYIISSLKDAQQLIFDVPRGRISFSPLKTCDIDAVNKFITAFLSLALPELPHPMQLEVVEKVIKKYKLEEIDIFLLSLLVKRCQQCRKIQDCDRLSPLSDILKGYCKQSLDNLNQEISLAHAAEVAFRHKVLDEPLNKQDVNLLELVYCHPQVCNYLIAYQMIEKLKSFNANKTPEDINQATNVLKCIQSNQVNRFCKEIINSSELNEQMRVIHAIEQLLKSDNIHYYAKSFACYLAGRFQHLVAKSQVYEVLDTFVIKILKDNNNDTDDYHLLLRSAYVSLVYLDLKPDNQNLKPSSEHLKEYIDKLLSEPKFDEVNRGFHLQYYGDQDLIASPRLICTDQLRPFPKTFEKLSCGVRNQREHPLWQIQLHTLCSLAQHRHEEGNLEPKRREEIWEILDNIIHNPQILNINNRLRTYVSMLHKHLNPKHKAFCVGRIFDDYYKIKIAKRTGWVKREITNGESVADHTYGAYLIALFLLPDSWRTNPNEEEYDKTKIMNMLLIHDLAEAKVHDIPTPLITADHRMKEAQVYDEIEMLGTYKKLPNLNNIAKLYREFETQEKFNARVAKDIDRLENWTQLQIYKAKGYEIDDYDTWSQKLIDKIQTDVGHLVRQKLEMAYSNLEKIKEVYQTYLNEEKGFTTNYGVRPNVGEP